MKILKTQKFQKMLSKLIYLGFHFFSLTAGLISSIKLSTESSKHAEENSLKKLLILFLESDYWYFEFSENAFNMDLSRFWTSYFPIAIDLISSVKASTESVFIYNYSIW